MYDNDELLLMLDDDLFPVEKGDSDGVGNVRTESSQDWGH